jgi:hypothetical protein
MTVILDLVEGVFYDIVLEYKELQHSASLKLEWESPSVQRGVIPSSNLFSTFRVANQVFQIDVKKGPSIPSTSVVLEADAVATVGILHKSIF